MGRQRTLFTAYIAKLESIGKAPGQRTVDIMALVSAVVQGLKDELTVIGLVMELDADQISIKREYSEEIANLRA